MRNIFLTLGLSALALTACGGSDPTPDPEDAAPAAAINASVDRAQEIAQKASNAAEAEEERAETGNRGAQPN